MSYIDPDQLHGALDGMITFLGNNAAALTAKGLNPTTVTTGLTSIRDDLGGKKNIRDQKKTDLKVAQQAFADSASANYTAFSNAVDTVAGALDKTSPAGQQVLDFRKHLNAAPQHHSSTPPAPPAA
ncbi:MAG TPA: hypothetical protein VIK35_11105 [Verrucomicrobiae bacterium]